VIACMMPSACKNSDKLSVAEMEAPFKACISAVEKKARNLEKRKVVVFREICLKMGLLSVALVCGDSHWCTDTSDPRHFGIMYLVPKCLTFLLWCGAEVSTSALKCMRHFGPRIKIGLWFECVKNVDSLYIGHSNGMEVLGKRLSKGVFD